MRSAMTERMNIPDELRDSVMTAYDESGWFTYEDEILDPIVRAMAFSLNMLPQNDIWQLEAVRLVRGEGKGFQAVYYSENPPLIPDPRNYRVLNVGASFNKEVFNPQVAEFHQPNYRTSPSFYGLDPKPVIPFTTLNRVIRLAENPDPRELSMMLPAYISWLGVRPMYFLNRYKKDNSDYEILGEDSHRLFLYGQIKDLRPVLHEIIQEAYAQLEPELTVLERKQQAIDQQIERLLEQRRALDGEAYQLRQSIDLSHIGGYKSLFNIFRHPNVKPKSLVPES